jgi:heme-degrading monooxygenase HmoA
MITEIAQIDIKAGMEAEFEAGVAKARTAFQQSQGFHGFELHRSIEKPQRYRLVVKWATLENHTVDFRNSENFTQWRGCVSHCFATPPEVEHTATVFVASAA